MVNHCLVMIFLFSFSSQLKHRRWWSNCVHLFMPYLCAIGMFSYLLVRSVDSLDACIYAEIRTRIPDTVSWDYNFEPAGSTPISFTVKVCSFVWTHRYGT